MKHKKTFILNPEDEERGFLLWLHLVNGSYRELFFANLIALICLIPAIYVGYVSVETMDLTFQLLFIALMGFAGPALTLLAGTACRISLRRPVWLKEDFKALVKQDLGKSVLLGVLVGAFVAVIFDAITVFYGMQGGLSLPVLLMALAYGYLAAGFAFFAFQQLAMLALPFGRILLNGFLLIFAGKGRSVLAILIPVLVVAVCLYFYGVGSLLLIAGVPALALLTSNQVFSPVFTKLFLEEG